MRANGHAIIVIAAALFARAAMATPCQTIKAFWEAYPLSANSQVLMTAKGVDDDDVYVLQVDPETCALPLSVTIPDVSVDISYDGSTGSAVPGSAAYVGGTDGTNLRGLKTDSSGELQVDVLTTPGPTGRVFIAGYTLDFSGTDVTSGAWEELAASIGGNAANAITVFSSCGFPLKLGVGAADSEATALFIPPGGIDAIVPLAVAASARLSLEAADTTCDSGSLVINLFR